MQWRPTAKVREWAAGSRVELVQNLLPADLLMAAGYCRTFIFLTHLSFPALRNLSLGCHPKNDALSHRFP